MDYDGAHDFNNFEIMFNKPAPIIITYLGFAGTSGGNKIVDYIVTDNMCTDISDSKYYSEKLFVLPHMYQPQDDLYKISKAVFTKKRYNIDENSFVFMCFNRNNKIDPLVANAWIEILRRCKNSVLLLYIGSGVSKDYFTKYFQSHGISNNRIKWCDKLDKPEHLARHKIGDLSLDTLYYGMHTTAADSLYMNIPVLTLKGYTFSNRVGSSLVRAANLPFLITYSIKDYINTAVYLYNHPIIIKQIKNYLKNNRGKYPLLDSKRYTKNLENGYKMLYDIYLINSTIKHHIFPIENIK